MPPCRRSFAPRRSRAAREAADAESSVNGNRTSGDYVHGNENVFRPEAHDRAFAILLLDLRDCRVQHFHSLIRHMPPLVMKSQAAGVYWSGSLPESARLRLWFCLGRQDSTRRTKSK